MTNTKVDTSRLHPNTLLDSIEAANYLGLSARTLNNWRHVNRGPAFCRVGYRAVRYRVRDLDRFIAERSAD